MTDRPSSPEATASHESSPVAGEKWPARRVMLWLLGIIAFVLVGWALRAVGTVAVPLVFSVLIALMIAPVDTAVKKRMPRGLKWLGHAAAMGLIIVILAAFVGGIWIAAQRVVAQFPQVSEELQAMAPWGTQTSNDDTESATDTDAASDDAATQEEADEGAGEPEFNIPSIFEQFRGASGQLGSTVADWVSGYASTILSSAGKVLGALVLIFFFVLLMLVEGPSWRKKASRVFAPNDEDGLLDSFSVIAHQLRRYLLVRAILGAATAVLYAAWLWIFGVDLLIVWALLAFLLNFIPTLGSLIAGILPVIYAFVQKDFSTAIFVGVGILVIEQVMGNYVDPRVQGKQLSLSPLVILLVLLLWGWIWGVAGALLAVPVTIALVVICAHFPRTRAFALLLSNETEYRGLDRMATSD